MREEEWREERAYLADVLARIESALEDAQRSAQQAEKELTRTQEHMWEHGPHILRSFDDIVESAALNQNVAADRRAYAHAANEARALRRMLEAPYFGRIDFSDHTIQEDWKIYIGRRGFSQDYEYYVFDWRSPIASLFYDYDCGPARFIAPQGEHDGELTLKRQFRIHAGSLESMYDADALIQDEILESILSEQAGQRLKVIAESIQKEQNRAIRFLGAKNMLVHGPAGSGKTSVGLHRMAYLLYHKRGQLNSSDMLAVSANRAFNEYIAGVLPDLYEADMQRRVFGELIAPFVPEGFRIGGYFEQTEYLFSAREDAERVRWIRALYSQDFLQKLIAYIDAVPIVPPDIVFMGETIATRADAQVYENVEGVTGYRGRLRRLDHFLRQRVTEHVQYNESALRDVLRDAVQRGELDLLNEEEIGEYLQTQCRDCIREHRRKLRERNGLHAMKLLQGAVDAYFGQSEEARSFHERVRGGWLHYEDLLALLCVKVCMGAVKADDTIRYCLLDEAQDYGAPQHFLLRALFPRAAFTLLADVHQAVLPPIAIGEAARFSALYPELLSFPLTKSYRFTGPIGALAAALFADGEELAYFERQGVAPTLQRTENLAQCVRAILRTEYAGTTAVLTITRYAAEKLYTELAPDVTLLTEEGEQDAQCLLMPLYLAKGLEFDRVILALEAGAHTGVADETRVYYLLCTRALHELHVVCAGDVPEVLENAFARAQAQD